MSTEADKIHAAIMNLPCREPGNHDWDLAFSYGHRHARHAAAELAQEAVASLERRNAVLMEACKDIESKIVDYEAGRINWRPDNFLYRVRNAIAGEGDRE